MLVDEAAAVLLLRPPLAVAGDGVEHEAERQLAGQAITPAIVRAAREQVAHVTHLDLPECGVFREPLEIADPRLAHRPGALAAFADRQGVHLFDGETMLFGLRLLALARDQLQERRGICTEDLHPAPRIFLREIAQQRLQAARADGPVHQAERESLAVEVPAQSVEAAALAGFEQTGDFHRLLFGRRQAAARQARFRLRDPGRTMGSVRTASNASSCHCSSSPDSAPHSKSRASPNESNRSGLSLSSSPACSVHSLARVSSSDSAASASWPGPRSPRCLRTAFHLRMRSRATIAGSAASNRGR